MCLDLQLLSSMISFEEDLLLNRLDQLEGVVDLPSISVITIEI